MRPILRKFTVEEFFFVAVTVLLADVVAFFCFTYSANVIATVAYIIVPLLSIMLLDNSALFN